ncbi:TAT-variant-translocated molybdopterin oxidoreductase [Niabella terrae]
MSNKYWQGFGQINDPEGFDKKVSDEFQDELPFENFDDKGLLDAKAPRRDFLKYLGFSTAAATLAASCKTKVRDAIPYAVKPDNIIPGEAKYYATTYVFGGDAVPVVAKVRDGRPIKIEGNELYAYTKGGTSAAVQASVLDLYDTHRLRHPQRKVGDKFEESTYEHLDKTIQAELNSAAEVVFLTSTINSPSTLDIISKFPKLRVVSYDSLGYSGLLEANEASGFGRVIPTYKFENADVIVSLGADFLGTWLHPIEQAAGYTRGRKIDEKAPKMSKHYQFESFLSMTGANADERFTHRASQTGAVALALLAAVGGGVTAPQLEAGLSAGIAKVAQQLQAAGGKGLVVCGSNDARIQTLVNAINSAIGAYGNTIDLTRTSNLSKSINKEFEDLLTQMEGGQVKALLIYGANPVYDYFNGARVVAALKKVATTVSFTERLDETTQLCKYLLPTHHYLECWGDAEPKTGVYAFVQPTINPLFKTRAYQDALLKWSGNPAEYHDYLKTFWEGRLGGETAYLKALQDGVLETAAGSGGTYSGAAAATAAAAVAALPAGGKDELIVYRNVGVGTGTGATNPWLQELPDPITRATWGNYALISLPKAAELGIELDMDYEYYPQKPVIKIQSGKYSVELPILVIPGMNANTIAVPLGYGRADSLGRSAAGVGENAFPFTSLSGANISFVAPNVTITDAGRKEKIAQTQIHNSYEGRVEVVRETTLATFNKYPNEIKEFRDHLEEAYGRNANDFQANNLNYRKNGTLYGEHEKNGLKWGMNVDMNACYGCGACVVACHIENNVPIVGKNEVARFHDMHWLRIDRYFVSDEQHPDQLKGVVFQPMMCQHCDNAPCENVCPVAATNHNEEGINQMAYNRCIGTRYCANNCPFKVRRFNWLDYTGADSFPDNQDQQLVGKLDDVVFQMNDPLTRMVLNPDVTVRSRGVMEKCSFCIQRTQHAKLEAKKQNRPLRDGEAKTACMQACNADAIVFGNIGDKDARITRERLENPLRLFYSLEQLHVLPNVSYLAKVRNTEEVIEKEGHGAGHEAGHEAAPAAESHH